MLPPNVVDGGGFVSKITIVVAISLVMIVSLAVATATEESDAIETGKCGSEVYYALDDDGTLTIMGSGAISRESFSNRNDIVNVIIEDGVTSIGKEAFKGSSIITVKASESLTEVYGSF